MSKNSTPINPYSYIHQIWVVSGILLSLVALGALFAVVTWDQICGVSLSSCFSDPEGVKPFKYVLLALVRPFTLFPVTIFSIMGAKAFVGLGPLNIPAILLMALASALSFMTMYGIAKVIGKKLVNPWLSSNLPQTFKFVRSQDWKIVIFTRLIPFFPFDILSFLYGIVDFRFKQTLLVTFLVSSAEAYLLIGLTDGETSVSEALIKSMILVTCLFIVPGIIYEWAMRKKGSGLFRRLSAMWNEIIYEIRLNNDVVRRKTFYKSKTPVLLIYGFFSSRRALSVMERLLKQRGYEVMSFNLGGMFGIFFTRGIIETANFINFKLMRQFERNDFKKIRIVAHSKGGLVALWWLLRLGGYRYCDKLITMGTPFKGSRYTWLALITPLGFLWKDVWQMRPGSSLLKALEDSTVPENLKIYCMHSHKDKVAGGRSGVFEPNYSNGKSVAPVPMNHISHFEYLYKRDVADQLSALLGDPDFAEKTESSEQIVANDVNDQSTQEKEEPTENHDKKMSS